MAEQEDHLTLDFLLRQAMHAVLTQRLFADAEAGEPLSLLWDLDLVAFGLDSVAVGKSFVGVWWSDSYSILVSPAMLPCSFFLFPRRCSRSDIWIQPRGEGRPFEDSIW